MTKHHLRNQVGTTLLQRLAQARPFSLTYGTRCNDAAVPKATRFPKETIKGVDIGHQIIETGAHDRLKEGGSVYGLVEMERA
jgi:hypothetical protein